MTLIQGNGCPAQKNQALEALNNLLFHLSDRLDHKDHLRSNELRSSETSTPKAHALSPKAFELDIAQYTQKNLDQII